MNRVSRVTGASRGIGPSTAIRRVEDRYDAVMNDLRQGGTARDDADRIEQAGQRSLAIRADVASETRSSRGSERPPRHWVPFPFS